MKNTCGRITCVKFIVLIVVLSRHSYLKSSPKHSTLKATAPLRNKIHSIKKKKSLQIHYSTLKQILHSLSLLPLRSPTPFSFQETKLKKRKRGRVKRLQPACKCKERERPILPLNTWHPRVHFPCTEAAGLAMQLLVAMQAVHLICHALLLKGLLLLPLLEIILIPATQLQA